MRPITVGAAAGLALGAYSLYEPTRFRLAEHTVPLRAGAPALNLLHLSDMHMTRRSKRLGRFLASLPDRLDAPPDLVVATGDLIEDDSGIEPLLEALAHVEARHGRFYVLGSHDYFQSSFRIDAYTKYFQRDHRPIPARPASTDRLEEGLRDKGWIGLANSSHVLETDLGSIRVAGVDDPYIERHRTGHITRAEGEVLAIGLVHAPDVVSEWMLNGFDLVLAGHTHAGQVRLPFAGALVTNCSLPAGLAGGVYRVGSGTLHVSPGLGSARFGPIRFNCPPEATLLRLVPSAG